MNSILNFVYNVYNGWFCSFLNGVLCLDINKLKLLLQQEEGPKLDFKAELCLSTESAKKELAKDVIAMANSRGGRGYIIFGVEDKTKEILGVHCDNFTEEKIQQVIYSRCDPPIPVQLDVLEYLGKKLAVLTIYRSNQRPHQMIQNGAFYIRRGSTTDIARREEIANMFQEHGLFSYERVLLTGVPLDSLDMKLIEEDFGNNFLLLEGLGIIGKHEENEEYHPTIGGLILYGRNPYLFLPHVYIKVYYNDQAKLFTGNVLKLLDDVELFLKEICADEHYPLQAVFDVLANAVVHRDYLDFSTGIQVVLHPKYIEVTNPGAMISGNRIYKYHKDNNPKRRNPWLYQRLLMIDKKGRFLKYGLGISRIRNCFANPNDAKFINLGSQNLFKVVLPGFRIKGE